MTKITVYNFTTYDIINDKTVRHPKAATAAAIKERDGFALLETAREVELSTLDGDGFEKVG